MRRSVFKIFVLVAFAVITFSLQLHKVHFTGTMTSSITSDSILKFLRSGSETGSGTGTGTGTGTEIFQASKEPEKQSLAPSKPQGPLPACITCTSNYSTAEVMNPRDAFAVNDTIQIRIVARDGRGAPKHSGGDYFRVKLYTKETESSSSMDVTNDLGNGTYTAEVTLRWPGKVKVITTLVHPSEAIEILERIRDIEPGRTAFIGRFSKNVNSKEVNEDVVCLPKVIANKKLCNFSDERTGYPWFCVAPSRDPLTCNDWLSYKNHATLSTKYTLGALKKTEHDIFKTHKLPIKVLTPQLNVVDKTGGWASTQENYQKSLPSCLPGQHLHNKVPSGFYHHNTWYSDQCNIHRFNKISALECLRNKNIHLFGDSTARQLYDYLSQHYRGDIVGSKTKFASQLRSGPMTAKDAKRNITIHFKSHGFPLRPTLWTNRDTINYIVNELDDLEVDDQSVILLSLSQHFTTYPISFYENRIKDIKEAVRRLHARSPRTLVIIKSANTREHSRIINQLQNSEWYIKTLDLSMRALFKDYPAVAFIDAWDMTTAQNFEPLVHPHRTVVISMMDQFFSFICPERR